METEITAALSYDGTFEGFLTAASLALEERLEVFQFEKQGQRQNALFSANRNVARDRRRAMKLWDALGAKSLGLHRIVYFSFLSESPGIETHIFRYLNVLFNPESIPDNTLHREARDLLNRWAGKVEAEKSALEARLCFHNTALGLPQCRIAPEYNVLPLLSRHFRMRFGSSPWIISDEKRGYSLYAHDGRIEILPSKADSLAGPVGNLTGKSAYRQAV